MAVPKMAHHPVWDFFLRYTALVPCPVQASASINYLLSSHSTGQFPPRSPEKKNLPHPLPQQKLGGGVACQ